MTQDLPPQHRPPLTDAPPPRRSGAFLVASSRWNAALGPSRCCCRVSEVSDWEEGGRTGPHHAERVFNKERPAGPRRVLHVVREVGPRGVRGGRGG